MPPSFFKINFDSNVADRGGEEGAGFFIRESHSSFVAVGGKQIYDISICLEQN